MTKLDTVSTGISELDKVLSGGLLQGRVYLISGSVSTGKTTAAVQFLLRGILDNENAAILTDSSTENLIEDMKLLGMDVETPIRNGSMRLISFNTQFEDLKNRIIEKKENPKKVLTKILSEIITTIKQNNIKRLVIDPITPLIVPSSFVYDYIKTLVNTLSDTRCTTIVTSGVISPNDPSLYGLEEHVSGVILLSSKESLKGSKRFFSIKKMRGIYCDSNLHEFMIQYGKGICSPNEKPAKIMTEPQEPTEDQSLVAEEPQEPTEDQSLEVAEEQEAIEERPAPPRRMYKL